MAVGHMDTPGLLRKHGYREIKKVGEGSFGKAILVQADNGEKLVCKMVDVSRASSKETQDAIKEAKVLASLTHPYIVRYRESFTECGWFCILMDFCESGDLTKQIEQAKRSRKPIPEEQVLKWFTQAILSLKHIHDRHILHRDLKPGNFFLSKSGNMKMGDFGIAKVLDCTLAVARTQIGTPYYLSPELCQEKPYTTPSDIWAMGCILYEMCALKTPFEGSSIAKLVDNIVRGRVPSVPPSYSSTVRQLVSEMLNRDPKKRPGCDELLQRPEIQAVVQSMMKDGQETEMSAAVSAAADAGPALKVEVKASEGPYKDTAGTFKKGDLVEYHSSAHSQWLPAVVTNADSDGRIMLDLKPNTWILKEKQATLVRPRSAGGCGPGSAPHRVSASPRPQGSLAGASPRCRPSVADASPSRRPSVCASPRRSPSVGSGSGRPSSCDGRNGPSVGSARPSSRDGRNVGQPLSGRGAAGGYKSADLCEFWSNSHNDWLPAQIIKCDAAGRIIIDLKPNTWLSKEDQISKIRPRRTIAPQRQMSANRLPQIGGSPQLPRPPLQRTPSWCSRGSRDSPSGRAMTPSGARAESPMGARAASPSGRMATPGSSRQSPSGRAMTPLGGRAASPSGRNPPPMAFGRPATPSRCPSSRDSPGRAASPRPGLRPPRVAASPLRAGGAAIAGYRL